MEDKILINKILNRQLSTVYEMIIKKTIQFNTNDSIKLLTYLCKICSENLTTPECINKNDLCQLTLHVWGFIKNPSMPSIETYLRSIFYIVKLLLVNDNFDKIIELKGVLIPSFLPAHLVDKQQEVYTAIWGIIYNKIGKILNVNDNLINNLLSLSLLLIEMYDRILDVRKQYLESLYRSWLNLERLGVDWEFLNQFYRGILANLTITPNRFEIILKIYSTNFNNLLNHNRCDLILEFHKYFIRLFKKFGNTEEVKLLRDLLEIYKFLITNNSSSNQILQSCHKSLKILHEKYNSNNFQIVCTVLTSNIVLVTQLLVKNPENYRKFFENQQYYEFLNDLSSIIAQCPYKCTCNDCCIKTRIYDAFTVSNTILQLGKLFLTKLEDCGDLIKDLLMYLEAILSFIVNLKDKNCIRWKNAWYDCGQLTYNIGKKLSEKNNDNSLKFLKKFIKYLIVFEGYNPNILNNYHTCCLVDIEKIYQYQKKDFEKSLTIIAYNIVISPQYRESLFISWVKCKVNCRNLNVLNYQKIQELTLVKVLEKYKFVVYYYDSNFKLTNDQKIELLQLELRAYKELWKSKIPMMMAFNELYQINNNNIGDLVDIFIDIWGDGDLDVNEDLPKLIPPLIKKYQESVRSNNDRLNLAHLHYLHQKYYLKDAIYKTTNDINKTVIFNTQETNNDPNDECDIVPSYENLKLNRYNKIMKHLDRALDFLSNLIDVNDSIDYDRIYSLLKKIGNEYRLHSNLVQSIYTWYTALKIANCKNNKLEIMESTGFLIELIDIKQSKIMVEEFIDKADRIADSLDQNQYFNQIITYYLCKSLYYYNSDIDKAYQIFCDKIYKFFDKFNGDCLMKTRILLLQHKFLMLPCKYQIIKHQDLTKLHQAYKDVVQYYNTTRKNDTSYEMSIFFEITEQIVLLYHNLRMPRELRCYSKEIVVLTQKLLLPYRTILLLYYLAYADLLSSRFDDCKVKITGLSYILCLQSKLTPTKTQLEQQQEQQPQISKEIDRLTVEFSEIMLDVPSRTTATTRTIKLNSPNSPNLKLESFELPSFFYHQQDCDCFQCVSVEFLEFLLKKTHLDLLLNVYQNDTEIVRDYCCGALKIFEFICNKQERFVQKFTNKLPTSLLPNIINLNLKTYSFILMEYGNVCLRANEIDKAVKINQNLLVQLSHFQFTDECLLLDVLTQKSNIILSSINDNNNDKNHLKIDLLTIDHTDDGPKTPESRQNPVTIPFKFIPATSPLPLKKNPIRTIQFDLDSDDNDNDDDNNSNNNAQLKTAIYQELFSEEKTPAPSVSKNCRVYTTRSTVRRQNSKKNIEESKQESSNNNNINVIPMSPEAYTPIIKGKLQTNLANRTKLLTERLRSNKKENINTDNTVEKTTTVRKTTTRKLRYN